MFQVQKAEKKGKLNKNKIKFKKKKGIFFLKELLPIYLFFLARLPPFTGLC